MYNYDFLPEGVCLNCTAQQQKSIKKKSNMRATEMYIARLGAHITVAEIRTVGSQRTGRAKNDKALR